MKKILAIAIVAIMMVALCVSASAQINVDRIFVNQNSRPAGDAEFGPTPPAAGSKITINAGDKLYTIGWGANPDGKLTKVTYSVDGGADVELPDNYRDRADLLTVGVPAADGGAHAGFGHDEPDENGENGMLELTGIDKLNGGEYAITLKAYFEGVDTPDEFAFTLVVEGELPAEDPDEPAPTSDAAIIAIAAVGCIALAGVVVAKKVK